MATSDEISAAIARAYSTNSVRGSDGQLHSIVPASVPQERGEFLYRICRAERPQTTLEVGMAWGLSTLFIMRALIDSATVSPRHVVMDPGQTSRYHDAALILLNELGLDSIIEFYPESSALVLPQLVSQGRKFDFAFIDGDHRFASVFIDVYFVDQLVKPGGVIVLDDTIWDGVSLASKFAEIEYGYQTLEELGKSSRRSRMRAYRKPERQPFPRGKTVAPFLNDSRAYWTPSGRTERGVARVPPWNRGEAKWRAST